MKNEVELKRILVGKSDQLRRWIWRAALILVFLAFAAIVIRGEARRQALWRIRGHLTGGTIAHRYWQELRLSLDVMHRFLGPYKSIRYLDLGDEITAEMLQALHLFPELQSLGLGEGDDESCRQIAFECPQLQSLYVDNANISDAGIAALGSLPKLRSLELIGPIVSDYPSVDEPFTGRGFEQWQQPSPLEFLVIESSGEFCDAGVVAMSKFPNLKELHIAHCIEIRWNWLEDESLRAPPPVFANLEVLSVKGLSDYQKTGVIEFIRGQPKLQTVSPDELRK
ncbi:MAG: hypothetical protein JWP89_6086 [Schlesneria sp.]|nr:hypothetical protein [Schlesneria sp.]